MEEARVLITQMSHELTMVSPRTAHLVLALLVAAGLWVAVARSWTLVPAAVTLLGTSLVWFRVDQRDEGEILLVFSASHGVTQADLAVPAVIGGALVLRALRIVLFQK